MTDREAIQADDTAREVLAQIWDRDAGTLATCKAQDIRAARLDFCDQQAIRAMHAFREQSEAMRCEAAKHMRHDGLCAIIGGYGFCSCGMEEARDALLAHTSCAI